MTQESVEVKVVRLETKMDAVLTELKKMSDKLDNIDVENNDKISRHEFESFKEELKAKSVKSTLLTAILTCVVTTLIGYVVIDVMGR